MVSLGFLYEERAWLIQLHCHTKQKHFKHHFNITFSVATWNLQARFLTFCSSSHDPEFGSNETKIQLHNIFRNYSMYKNFFYINFLLHFKFFLPWIAETSSIILLQLQHLILLTFFFFFSKHQNIDGEINLSIRCDIWLDVKMS